MPPRLTFSRNRVMGEYIIQLIIDDSDLLIPIPIELPSIRLVDQLTYLAELVQAIEDNRKEKDMLSDILEPDLDEELEDEPLPSDDEDNLPLDEAERRDEEMDTFPEEEEGFEEECEDPEEEEEEELGDD